MKGGGGEGLSCSREVRGGGSDYSREVILSISTKGGGRAIIRGERLIEARHYSRNYGISWPSTMLKQFLVGLKMLK